MRVLEREFVPKRGQRLEDFMKRMRAAAKDASTPSHPV
jgi:hypothetical protein